MGWMWKFPSKMVSASQLSVSERERSNIRFAPSIDMADALDSAALTAALKAHATLTRDQKTALVRALDGFVSYLGSSASAGAVLSQDSWQSRERWDLDEWSSWQTWGWYRQFCRAVSLIGLCCKERSTND